MKSFNGLYDAMMKPDEIKLAILKASKGKRKRRSVKWALAHLDEKADQVARKIEEGRWRPTRHPRQIYLEGPHKKERTIEKPQWDDEQIVHHMLMRQFIRITEPRTYRYACGSLPGRGALFAARTLRRWRDEYRGKKFYVFEGDVHKCYDNVDLDLLKQMLRKFIRDKRYLRELEKVIDNSSPGLPKGHYTSPHLACFYLTKLDRYITQELRPDHYLRFVDNLFIYHSNKRELHEMTDKLEAFLFRELHMELNPGKQVYLMEHTNRRTGVTSGRAVNVLGYVVHETRMTMRKGILKRARAKANHMHKRRRCRRIDAAAILSYKGWFNHTDTYNYFQKWIKPKVSIRYCRRRISLLAKRERMMTYDPLACSA